MGIVEYKFDEFTDKDMFHVRLAGTIPDFGYITCKTRRPFYEFCVKQGFISLYSKTSDGKTALHNVHTTFRFSAMFSYAPKPVIVPASTNMIMVGKDFRMSNTRI